MFIDGERADIGDTATADVLNPAAQEFLDMILVATAEDAQCTVGTAQIGKRVWVATPAHKRSGILTKCADTIDARREELAVSLPTEVDKTVREARDEIRVCVQIFHGFAEAVSHHYGKTMTNYQAGTENDMVLTQRGPLDVVACISPFNYPVELCLQKAAAALTAKNAVIIRPVTDNPLMIVKTVGPRLECGVPDNVLQLVTGSGAVVDDMLINSDRINAISLTGSTAIGRGIAKAGAETLKCIFLELDGSDPFIVFEDVGMELAIAGAIQGRVQNAGQTCCAPKRFLVQSPIKKEFIQRVVQRLENLGLGSPLDKMTEFDSLISSKIVQEVKRQVDLTVTQGAKLLYDGDLYDESCLEPTVLGQMIPEMEIVCNMGTFGPVFPIIGFDTEEEAVQITNHTIFGLQVGVMNRDMRRVIRVASQLECGGVVTNGSGNHRHTDQPFGGWKMSGVGREGTNVMLDKITQEKSYIPKNISCA